MRCVFVSDVSPARGHVYGLRLAAFARAMAARGHAVLILAPASNSRAIPHDLATRIRDHDWRDPLLVELTPEPRMLVSWHRSRAIPGPLRRALTAYLILAQGGVQGDWVAGAETACDTIVGQFRPDVVWATFGNLSNLVVGQRLAARARVPWVADFKDNFTLYVPAGLRRAVARRFRDTAAVTTNAVLHSEAVPDRLFPQPRAIVYSGGATDMVAPPDSLPRPDRFVVTLVGSTYNRENLRRFLHALATWIGRGDGRAEQTQFRYAGASHADVADAVGRAGLSCETQVTANIPHHALADLCHEAAANCYLWAPFTFHHKALELMSCRRPVIAFPGEHAETIDLAARVGGHLDVCRSEEALMDAFDAAHTLWRERRPAAPDLDISGVSWEAGAAALEGIFARAALGIAGHSG